MDKDLDIKLYNDFLAGDTKAFEILYLKYKNKVQYFIYNIIKNNEKAEDITQEVFMYIFKNKLREKCSFKNYIYLVAKSRAINYLNKEKRRKEITDTYLSNKQEEIQEDATEIIEKMEERKQLIESINMLDEKYKNAIYLNKIEGFSYKETAEILNISIQNVKNLIHRGKKELRKILIKTGYNKMNKISKIIVIILALSLTLTGVVYAINKIYPNIKDIYGLIILISIFTTAISLGISFLKNTSKNNKDYSKITIVICLTSVIFSKFGFSNLVSLLYPILGFLGIIQIIQILF